MWSITPCAQWRHFYILNYKLSHQYSEVLHNCARSVPGRSETEGRVSEEQQLQQQHILTHEMAPLNQE